MFFQFEPLSIPDVIRITPARHDDADLVYKVSNEFDAAFDRGIAWDDPVIGVPWPVENPTLSARDLSLPGLESATSPFQYVQ